MRRVPQAAHDGRPSTDPVVLFKIAIIQHLYGLSSLRRTAEEFYLNNAYRWFLGYSLSDKTPHLTTLSNNFCHWFTEETVERVFSWILGEINKAGYLSPEAVFISKNCVKTVEKHIRQDYMELVENYRHTPHLRNLYEKRKETIERVFADAKEKCAMRFTYLCGLTRNLGWVRLKFAAMNLKKYAIHKWHIRVYFVFCLFPRKLFLAA